MTYQDIDTYVTEHVVEYGITEDELAAMTEEEFRKRILAGGVGEHEGDHKIQGVYDEKDPRIDWLVATIYEQQKDLWESPSSGKFHITIQGIAEIPVKTKDGREYILHHDIMKHRHVKTKDVQDIRVARAQKKMRGYVRP